MLRLSGFSLDQLRLGEALWIMWGVAGWILATEPKPALYQRTHGIVERGLLHALRSTCAASSLRLRQSRWQLRNSRPTKSPKCQGSYLNTSTLSGRSMRPERFHCLHSKRLC